MVREQELIRRQVDPSGEGLRLDAWLSGQLPEMSRSKIQKLIASGDILRNANACRAKDILRLGDEITVHPAHSRTSSHLRARPLPLDIVYEDAELLVVNKAHGVAVHPGPGLTEPTLVEGLLYHTNGQLSQAAGAASERPGLVHRLDKDTSGLLVCAKTEFAHRGLAAQFQAKTNRREYLALLNGVVAWQALTYESYLRRDPGNRLRFASLALAEAPAAWGRGELPRGVRWAQSTFERQAVYGHRLSLVRVRLATGRTHQIRVHSQALGAPIWGDPIYGRPAVLPKTFAGDVSQLLASIRRQLLHAEHLGFVHPRTGESLSFQAPLPDDFRAALGALRAYQIGEP